MNTWLSRVPPNIFSIAFGLCGLAELWHLADETVGGVGTVVFALYVLTLVVWLGLVGIYVAKLATVKGALSADWNNEILAPFISVGPIVGMILGVGLYDWNPTCGRILTVACAVLSAIIGGLLAGTWIADGLQEEKLHPGYFLPTVAGGLIGASSLVSVGLTHAAWVAFGIGVICWLVLGSLVLNRLFFRPSLPTPLLPLLAIEVAPPAVAGIAWFKLTGDQLNPIQLGLSGYCILMVLVQIRLIGRYRTVPFAATYWAFTFSYCAVAAYAIMWFHTWTFPGWQWAMWALVIALTGLVGVIAIKTLSAIRKGTFLPPAQPAVSE